MKKALMIEHNEDEKTPESITIESVASFLASLQQLNLGSDDYYKREYFFRGHSDKDWRPTPSIYRNTGWIENEDLMMRDLISRCPNDFKEHKYTFQSLVKMQHYSLPTRLLDVTTNPLISLYFACHPEKKTLPNGDTTLLDGEVIIFCPYKDSIKYYDSDTVSVISNIAKRPKNFNLNEAPKSEKEINAFNATNAMQLLLHDIKHEKPHFEPKILRSHIESVVFVRPTLDNPRIIKQDSAFILFGIDGSKINPAKIESYFYPRKKHPRLFVSATKKSSIQKELEILGVSESTVFPEIDHVSKFIKLKYQSSSI